MIRIILSVAIGLILLSATAEAQIGSRSTQKGGNQVATLNEILVNNLRATLPEQQEFLAAVVAKTEAGELERGLVLAVMRYAQRENARFPFPFYERAIRHQAAARNISLPSVATIVSTKTKFLR